MSNPTTEQISETHPQYDAMIYVWRMVRDFVSGPAMVKRQNTLYLPIPSAMTAKVQAPDSVSEQQSSEQGRGIGDFSPATTRESKMRIDNTIPWYYPHNQAYQSYLRRARCPDMTAFALRGLLGIATRKKPTVSLPSSIAYLEKDATRDGFDIYEMFSFMVSQILQTGRIGLHLDVTDENKFKFNLYSSDSAINWKEKVESGNRKIRFVVLQEDSETDAENPFSHDVVPKYLVLCTDENGNYKSDVYTKDASGNQIVTLKEPMILSKRINEIPFVFAGSIDNTPDVDESPLQGVADICNHIYMKEADLANAEFMTCNPTLCMTGVDTDEAPSATGSNVIITVSNPDAKVFYTETDTSALDHMSSKIQLLQEEAAAFGATLLGARKKGVESAESKRVDGVVGGATLQSVVLSAASAIETLLNFAVQWSGGKGEVVFEASTEFANIDMSSKDMTAMMDTYMKGGMSLETLVENWRRAGLLQEGDSVEDEIERINKQVFSPEDEEISLDDDDESELELELDDDKTEEDEEV